MDIAEEQRDPSLLTEAHLMICISRDWPHDVQAALNAVDAAAAHFETVPSGFVEFRVGPNPGVVTHATGGLLRWEAGFADAAVSAMERSLDLAEALDHPYSRAFALHHATLLDLWRSDLASVRDRAEDSLRLADTHDFAILESPGTRVPRGGAGDSRQRRWSSGNGAGLHVVSATDDTADLLAGTAGDPSHHPRGCRRRRPRPPRRSKRVDEPHGRPPPRARGDRHCTRRPSLRCTGVLDLVAAEAEFERAVALAADRGAWMLELQALTRLAIVRRGGPNGTASLERLRRLHATFTEGFTARPLLEAAATLADN